MTGRYHTYRNGREISFIPIIEKLVDDMEIRRVHLGGMPIVNHAVYYVAGSAVNISQVDGISEVEFIGSRRARVNTKSLLEKRAEVELRIIE